MFADHETAGQDTQEEHDKTETEMEEPYKICVEQSPITHPSQAAIQCDDCKTEVDVDKLCKTCQMSLCVNCAKRHILESDDHVIVTRTGRAVRKYELSDIVKPCPVHSAYEATYYCNNCNRSCCIKCIEKRHHHHSIKAIEKKYMECEDKLNCMVREIEKITLPALVSNRKQLIKESESHEKVFQDVEKEVNRFREEMKTMVDERCDTLLVGLKQTAAEQMSDIRTIISETEKQIKETGRFISVCAEKIREGGLDLIEFSRVTPYVTEKNLSDVSLYIPTFVPTQELLDSIKKLVGEIEYKGEKIDLTV